MSISSSKLGGLPLELIDEIVSHASKEDTLACCRVCRTLQAIATRRIYRFVRLETPARIVKGCRAIIANPAAANAVRALTLFSSFDDMGEFNVFWFLPAFHRLIRRALSRIKHVEELSLLFSDKNKLCGVTTCDFPRLVHFHTTQPFDSHFASFFARHPQLRSLHLSTPHFLDPLEPSSLRLPCLDSFSGPSYLIPVIMPPDAPPLRDLAIFWSPTEDDSDTTLRLLQPCTKLESFHIICRRLTVDILTSISQNLPTITSLGLQTSNSFYVAIDAEEFPNAISTILPRFSRLKQLSFMAMLMEHRKIGIRHLDADFYTVVAWGRACPTLLHCTLPSSVMWVRIRGTVWLPRLSDTVLSERWLRRCIGNSYSEMDEFEEVMADVLGVVIPGTVMTDVRDTASAQESLAADDENTDDGGDSDAEDSDEDGPMAVVDYDDISDED
ncbi:hypothetical protein PLICRDRAFT_47859 [Plicaturopsis crispa FD-325 SS-3]|nr:hypothetical protein PLICRDRAFT_47859 [Plicaturopsis crispa FD-325 SS-3]